VGLSRHIIHEYNDEWIRAIEDLTPLVHKIRDLRAGGKPDAAKKLLPPERVYPVPESIARRVRGA
jgi:hypothetical protein